MSRMIYLGLMAAIAYTSLSFGMNGKGNEEPKKKFSCFALFYGSLRNVDLKDEVRLSVYQSCVNTLKKEYPELINEHRFDLIKKQLNFKGNNDTEVIYVVGGTKYRKDKYGCSISRSVCTPEEWPDCWRFPDSSKMVTCDRYDKLAKLHTLQNSEQIKK